MVMSETQYLDRETILRKLPNISPSEVPAIKERLDAEDEGRMGSLVGAVSPQGGDDGVGDDAME